MWRESGGPRVGKPGTTGFGSRLIERGLAAELRAEVRLEFEPTGVVFTLSAPLSDSLRED
jgi:two-component sensor histidine kinase